MTVSNSPNNFIWLLFCLFGVSLFFEFSCKEREAAIAVTNVKAPTEESLLLQNFIDSCFQVQSRSKIDDSTKVCMVIPSTGCPGCISSAEQLLFTLIKENYPVKFILTNLISIKTLRLKVGDSIVKDPRVFVDAKNFLGNNILALKQTYPLICYLDNAGRLIKYEYMEPDNPEAVKHLYTYLEKPF